MADNSDIKTIKQRVAALKELMKTQEGLTAAKQKELTLLRQELKDVRTLGKAAQKRLETIGDRDRLEKMRWLRQMRRTVPYKDNRDPRQQSSCFQRSSIRLPPL